MPFRRGMTNAGIGAALLGLSVLAAPALALETSLTAPDASPELADRLRASSSVMNAGARGLDTPLELLSAALSDYRTLVQILYDAGHFSPVVNIRVDGREAAAIDPLNVPPAVARIDIAVAPGPVFRFGRAEIGPLAPDTELPEVFAPDQVATTGALRDAAAAAVLGWRNAGHAKAQVAGQKITARHDAARLDAGIDLDPGRRLRFGRMSVSGDTDVREDSIRRIAGFPTGEVYSPQQVQKVGTRLRRTGAFSNVTIDEGETPNPDDTLDFGIGLEDMPKRRITFGVELSSREGLDVSTIWLHRNLFGGAERFQFEASVRNIGGTEDIDGRIGARLDRPDRLGPDDSIFYLAEYEWRNRTHYRLRPTGLLGIGAKRNFSDDLYSEAYFGLNYVKADDAFGDGRRFEYLVLPIRTQWDRRDNKVSATRGFYLDGTVTPFFGIGSSESGGRIFVDGRGYLGLGAGAPVVLAGRMQIGSVFGPELNEVSPEALFFSGGAGSVRGQPYESLGVPVGGEIAGGRSYVAVSAEIRGKITEKISLVGFYDLGFVDSTSLISADAESHSGAGIGVRYDLGGFGPLRVDLAYPVSGDTGEGLQFYIGIGQAF